MCRVMHGENGGEPITAKKRPRTRHTDNFGEAVSSLAVGYLSDEGIRNANIPHACMHVGFCDAVLLQLCVSVLRLRERQTHEEG